MTLPEVIETIIRQPSGGAMTDENKLDREFVASCIHQVSAEAKVDWFAKKMSLHDKWFQTIYPDYEAGIQTSDNCITRFRCPSVINLSSLRDGFEYVGSPIKPNNFIRAGLGGMKAVFANHRITKTLTTWSWNYDETGYGVIEIQGNKRLRSIKIVAAFSDPTEVPTYRYEVDEYPVTEELFPYMTQRLFQLQTQIIVKQRADVVPDSQDPNNINQPQ